MTPIEIAAVTAAVQFTKDINADLTALPEQTWHWGNMEAAAQEAFLTARADQDQKHAECYKRMKEAAQRAEQKTTEAMIDAQVELDPEYRRYVMKAIEAESNVRRIKAVVEALRCKRDTAVQIAYNHRSQVVLGGNGDSVMDGRRRNAG